MKFEESIKRLDEIIEKLENNETSLEEAIEIYREGAALLGNCRKQLEQAELLVTVADGENDDTEKREE
ncbi:MAG: exodeoxyribonuclease VII small subunit [Oscillospiraceae bacterium]|nr:exodeoxyribonuclease VII small subunit [Oscillospiraceae bacterium]